MFKYAIKSVVMATYFRRDLVEFILVFHPNVNVFFYAAQK